MTSQLASLTFNFKKFKGFGALLCSVVEGLLIDVLKSEQKDFEPLNFLFVYSTDSIQISKSV